MVSLCLFSQAVSVFTGFLALFAICFLRLPQKIKIHILLCYFYYLWLVLRKPKANQLTLYAIYDSEKKKNCSSALSWRFILNGRLGISDLQLSLCWWICFGWIFDRIAFLETVMWGFGNQKGHWETDKCPMGTTQLRHSGPPSHRRLVLCVCVCVCVCVGVCVCVCVCVWDGVKKGWDLQSRFSHLGSPVFRMLWDSVERMGWSRPASFRCPVGVPDVGSSIYPWFRPAPLKISVRCIVNTACCALRKKHTHTHTHIKEYWSQKCL